MQLGFTDIKKEDKVLTVSQLTNCIKTRLEGDFRAIQVRGEISNFRPASSGHVYFSLKDSDATCAAALFRGVATKHKSLKLRDGVEVICHGRISVYPPRGSYQIIVEKIEPVGAGNLQAAFEALKKKLLQEGLFAEEHKKPIPKIPRRIAVITSPTGAAIRDVLSVVKRRYANLNILVVPALVQGENADKELVRGIKVVNKYKLADVILLTRGGGSLEDLWCFNSELLARAIFKSNIPIVSAVGHEIDFTIADFVADLRAATPSAAAEILTSEKAALQEKLSDLKHRLCREILQTINGYRMRLHSISSRLKNPRDRITDLRIRLDDWNERLVHVMRQNLKNRKKQVGELQIRLSPASQRIVLERKTRLINLQEKLFPSIDKVVSERKHRLSTISASLNALSPLRVLERGYSLVYVNKQLVSSAERVKKGDALEVRLARGKIAAKVEEATVH